MTSVKDRAEVSAAAPNSYIPPKRSEIRKPEEASDVSSLLSIADGIDRSWQHP